MPAACTMSPWRQAVFASAACFGLASGPSSASDALEKRAQDASAASLTRAVECSRKAADALTFADTNPTWEVADAIYRRCRRWWEAAAEADALKRENGHLLLEDSKKNWKAAALESITEMVATLRSAETRRAQERDKPSRPGAENVRTPKLTIAILCTSVSVDHYATKTGEAAEDIISTAFEDCRKDWSDALGEWQSTAPADFNGEADFREHWLKALTPDLKRQIVRVRAGSRPEAREAPAQRPKPRDEAL